MTVIEYLSGLTTYTFDKAVLDRIALDRGVEDVTDATELTKQQKDLLLADLFFVIYYSPNVWASFDTSHNGFSKKYGSQTIYLAEKEKLYNYMYNIYRQYEDEKLEELSDEATVFFRNDI